jgi:hypothetical protein
MLTIRPAADLSAIAQTLVQDGTIALTEQSAPYLCAPPPPPLPAKDMDLPAPGGRIYLGTIYGHDDRLGCECGTDVEYDDRGRYVYVDGVRFIPDQGLELAYLLLEALALAQRERAPAKRKRP